MLDTYHIARKFDGELRLGSHYIHPRCSTEVSNEHVVPVSHPLICPLCFHRPHSVLVICCGLLAKWLRVRVRVRVRIRAGARKCTRCPFFSSGLISVVNTIVFIGSVVSVSMRLVTYGIRSCDLLR